jgi:uncharacterized LabA/DUF88 family protein
MNLVSAKIDNNNPPVATFECGEHEYRRVFCVYIDGSNLYHRIRACGIDERYFDYRKFINWLVGAPIDSVKYYVGKIQVKKNDKKSQKLRSGQQERFKRLKNAGFHVVRGRFLNVEGKYIEKGVDVRIGVDLVVGALKNYYEKAFLISSDGDLEPAMEYAIKEGKKEIVYVAFEGSKLSYHLVQQANHIRMIKKSELQQFVINPEK